MKSDLKEKVFKLRKTGKSYNQISKTLNIPKSTLSDWLKSTGWSNKIKIKLQNSSKQYSSDRMKRLNIAKRSDLVKIYQAAVKEAEKEFKELKWFPLFISGISIYWGEGDKINKYLVRVSNVDPDLLKVYKLFLTNVCGVNESAIKTYILIYPDLDQDTCIKYWSKNLKLPLENFTKCVKIQGRHKTKRLNYGVCTVYVSSAYLKKKMLKWIELSANEFNK